VERLSYVLYISRSRDIHVSDNSSLYIFDVQLVQASSSCISPLVYLQIL
jgi:hypothetical protein